MGSNPPQGRVGSSIQTTELDDDSVTDLKIATHVSTKITGLPQLTQNLDFANTIDITWVGSSTRRIKNSGLGFEFDVQTGDVFDYEINNVLEMRLSSTSLDLQTNNLTLGAGSNLILDATTGTKIGTGTTQKLGFWNVTPVVQPAHIVDADGTLADITTKFNTLLADLAAQGLQASA